tara:strand:+ start:1064 stop:1714 length:651 start_codon:yes stop_codon:yes gene_type:complete
LGKINAVVWDCDGTLLDTEALFAKAWQLVMKDYDVEISNERMITYTGMDDKIVHAELSREANLPNFETTMDMLHNAIDEKLSDKDLVFEDVPKCLEYLLKNNIKQGCASASPEKRLIEKLTKSDLIGYFESIYGGDMVENNKPSPEIYLATFKDLDVIPEEVLVIEDSPYGIESGKRSGAQVLAIDRGMFSEQQLSSADYKLDSLDGELFKSIVST